MASEAHPPAGRTGAEGEGEMTAQHLGEEPMKPLIGLIALLFAMSALAQAAPQKAGKKSPVQAKPQAPTESEARPAG
jgi:hypothetical protein